MILWSHRNIPPVKKAMPTDNFDSNQYWRQRHDRYQRNSQGVGNVSFSQKENDDIYARSRNRLGKVLDFLKVPSSALDLGCGIGLMAEPFITRGINYHGVDISPRAIDLARSSYPDSFFTCSDIARLELSLKFQLIIERAVFIHLVDDNKWFSALSAAKTHLEPNGIFLLHDKIPEITEQPAHHVIFWK